MPEELPSISPVRLVKTARDYKNAASLVKLVYVNDKGAGIIRIKKGKGFAYLFENNPVKSSEEIDRIKKLAIPPSWTNVWICPLENGHIQATGVDLRQRKQYKYHALWNHVRNETKFYRLYEFGCALPQLRDKIEHDMSLPQLCQEKVIATVISLMERTYIRIGNSSYEKIYGSYGLTTLKDKHAVVKGDKILFCFNGKKGIGHNITLRSKRLARAVKECRDIPGKELFQYYDADNNRKSIDSSMVNNYIKASTGKDFTAKDFRTWAGSLQALRAFKYVGEALTDADHKKNYISVIDYVSSKLGNTRTVCRKYYIHPHILKLYEENKLKKYLAELDKTNNKNGRQAYTTEEYVLLKILKGTITRLS